MFQNSPHECYIDPPTNGEIDYTQCLTLNQTASRALKQALHIVQLQIVDPMCANSNDTNISTIDGVMYYMRLNMPEMCVCGIKKAYWIKNISKGLEALANITSGDEIFVLQLSRLPKEEQLVTFEKIRTQIKILQPCIDWLKPYQPELYTMFNNFAHPYLFTHVASTGCLQVWQTSDA